MDFGIVTYAAIAALCYAVGVIIKPIEKIPNNFIPPICVITGMILGVVAFVTNVPDFPANDIINALAVGAVSGGAAVAANQIGKQIKRYADENNEVMG